MLLDYLFVERCRMCHTLIGANSSEAKTVCADCWKPLMDQSAQIDICAVAELGELKVAHAVTYEETMKMLIYKLKYDCDRLIARDLSFLLSRALMLVKEQFEESSKIVIVPVPLSRWRRLHRGFNQAELLARHLKKERNVEINTRLLFRNKHTRAQHKLSREERAENLRGAFKCRNPIALLEDNAIILVDDIHTSGSTLAEAASTLKMCGAKRIAAITVARALLTGTSAS